MTTGQHELTIERVFDAPPELVFDCWASADHMSKWSGPAGFTVPHMEIDFRVGGKYRACLRSPEGHEMWVSGTYREIDRPNSFVLALAWEGDDGALGSETVMTVSFAETSDGKTMLTLRQAGFDSTEARDGNEGGWNETLDGLVHYLAELQR